MATPSEPKRSTMIQPHHANPYRDDGVTEPFQSPEEYVDYVAGLDPELVPTLHGDPERIEEWQDARFGVFMHWDPSCQMTGSTSWARKGRRPHHPSDGTVDKGIDSEVYDALYKTFNPVKFDADEWVEIVKAAGAAYLVITAKHHQGFCMFDSAVTDYDIMSTPFARDICKELADACHRHGIKLLFYYSQPDWNEERYRVDYPSPDFDRYVDEFLFPQLRELVTNYGELGGIWWDGLGKHPDMWRTPKLWGMLRELQPHLLFNPRCAPKNFRLGDYDCPENQIGRFQTNRPWETCMTIGGPWGWAGHGPGHSLADCVSILVRCAGNGGNLLLDTGPAPDGTLNPRHVERYLQMGAWLRQFGESVYATRGGPYRPGPWGCATRQKDGNTVFLHVLGQWDGVLALPDLDARVLANRVLTGGTATVTQVDDTLSVAIDPHETRGRRHILHDFDTIIALELDRPAMDVPIKESVSACLSIGATAEASSAKDDDHPARTLVAADLTEFSDGIFVKRTWIPVPDDPAPQVQLVFPEAAAVEQIAIQEGRIGATSAVEAFTISLGVDGDWQEVYSGNGIGGGFGLVLPQPVAADAIRVEFQRWHGQISINQINVRTAAQRTAP